MDIERLADACGGLAWICEQMMLHHHRLATADTNQPDDRTRQDTNQPDDRTRALLARSGRRFAQHEGWWRDLLPDSPALKGAERVGPPTQDWATQDWNDTFNRLANASASQAVEMLYGEMLAALVKLIEGLVQEASPVSDAPFARVAKMALADLAAEQVARKS